MSVAEVFVCRDCGATAVANDPKLPILCTTPNPLKIAGSPYAHRWEPLERAASSVSAEGETDG